MKTILITFCLTICMRAAFGVEAEKAEYTRAWALADPVLVLLLLVCVWNLSAGKWRLDGTGLFMFANVLVLGFSALVNDQFSNGTLLNFAERLCRLPALHSDVQFCPQRP